MTLLKNPIDSSLDTVRSEKNPIDFDLRTVEFKKNQLKQSKN